MTLSVEDAGKGHFIDTDGSLPGGSKGDVGCQHATGIVIACVHKFCESQQVVNCSNLLCHRRNGTAQLAHLPSVSGVSQNDTLET